MITTLLPELFSLDIDEVVDEDVVVRVRARTTQSPVACPLCGRATGRVHAYHRRRLAAIPSGGRGVVVDLQVRRLRCLTSSCPRRTFREQVPGLTGRWARRTRQLTALIGDLGVTLAGRAGATVPDRLGARVSRCTVLRVLMAVPVSNLPVPAVLSVDDFALRRGHHYATLLIDAVTHRRVDVLPDRKAETLAAWLRRHPQVQVVCRDGSAAYAEAIRTGAPQAVQVSDRWHLWANLAKAVENTVIAHHGCWHDGPVRPEQPIDQRNRDRHQAIHTLLAQGHGLLECARRLGWALNTVKRYARARTAGELQRPPGHRRTLVDPFRDHLRRRRAEDPDIPVTRLLAEIRELGYTGSANLLIRYLHQGRADAVRKPPSPRRLVSWLMTAPTRLPASTREHLHDLLAACAHLTGLAIRVGEFASLLTARRGRDLDAWMTAADADDLPALHSYVHGLRKSPAPSPPD